MEINYYYIVFPEGEKQQIFHKLNFGDIVDINGNLILLNELDPYKITYRVSGIIKKNNFKETYTFYKLELLTRDEVYDEINFNEYISKKSDYDFDKIYKKIINKKK